MTVLAHEQREAFPFSLILHGILEFILKVLNNNEEEETKAGEWLPVIVPSLSSYAPGGPERWKGS